MRMNAILPALLILAALPAAAQQRVDETIPSATTGEVEIVNTSGSVTVTGWNRSEIRVTGTLGEGTERLELDRGRERTAIRVVLPRNARNVQGSDLEIHVPAGKSVRVRTVSADVAIDDVQGRLAANSTSGDIQIAGRPVEVVAGSTSGDVTVRADGSQRVQASSTSGDVEISGSVRESVSVESVSGDVVVTATTPEVRAKAVSGDVRLQGVSGRISASTVSGDALVRDSRIQYGSFETVSGKLRYEGDLVRGAALDVQSHSGSVELVLPAGLSAEIEASTFSGDIVNEFGGTVRRKSRYAPGQELRFTAGQGGGLITAQTFSGTLKLLRR